MMVDKYLINKLENSNSYSEFLLFKSIAILYYLLWFSTLIYIFIKKIVFEMEIHNYALIIIGFMLTGPTSINVFLKSITISYELLQLQRKLKEKDNL